MKLTLLFLFVPAALAIWPIPSSLSTGNSTLWIDEGVAITYNGPSHVGFVHLQDVFHQYAFGRNTDRIVTQTASYSSNRNTTSASSSLTAAVIQAAISRTSQTLFQQNFLPWKFHPRNTNFPASPNQGATIYSITLQQTQPDPSTIANPHDGDVDESYSLTMTESGEVTITAASSFGIAHGLTTFTQLFYQSSYGGIYTPYAPVSIKDAPLFPHRGLNMDLSRNFFAISDIERMIDALAYNKFNRMHLHITDSQSWPLQIPSLPGLANKGAYESSLSYSPAQIQQIQYYGFLQGVSVYLEIDSPGHSASIAYSYPDLIASFNIQPNWDDFAAEPPSGTLKLNSSAVYDFMDTLYSDLLPRINPYSAYFHSGGDEVNQNAYLNDDTVRSNETSVLQPLLQKFVDRNHDQIRANGMTPVVWEEMLLTWNLTLGSDVVVQTWISDASVAETTAQGHYALAGNYEYWYLDCGQGQWINFPTGPLSEEFWPFADYCSPRKNWRLMYSYDPLQGVAASDQHLVLGGECHIWAEQTDPISLDRMVWPRAAAAAEVLWSGAKDASGQNRSQVEAAPRLSEMRERLVAKGVNAEPIQMPFCLQNPDQCTLPSS